MIAKNNIFNIRAGRAQWVGMTGTRRGFVEFDTCEHAIRAWLILMRNYRQKYGCKTIRQIVTRFAPPNENDTERYIEFCCDEVYADPDYVFDHYLPYNRLAVAMARMETGTRLEESAVTYVRRKYGIEIL